MRVGPSCRWGDHSVLPQQRMSMASFYKNKDQSDKKDKSLTYQGDIRRVDDLIFGEHLTHRSCSRLSLAKIA